MKPRSPTEPINADGPEIVAWRTRYQRYLQRMEDFRWQQVDFEQQRQAYHAQCLAYQLMREGKRWRRTHSWGTSDDKRRESAIRTAVVTRYTAPKAGIDDRLH